jgi:hypothetical protein
MKLKRLGLVCLSLLAIFDATAVVLAMTGI